MKWNIVPYAYLLSMIDQSSLYKDLSQNLFEALTVGMKDVIFALSANFKYRVTHYLVII